MNPEGTRLQQIAERLRKYRHALIGGQARNAYIHWKPRGTSDIDVLLMPGDAEAFASEIASMMPEGSVAKRPLFLVVRRKKKKVADVGFATNHPLYARAFADAREMTVPALGPASVIPPEALVVMKAMSAVDPRRLLKPESAGLDEADALAVLGTVPINEAYMAELAALIPPEGQAKLAELKARAAMRAPDEDDEE